MIKELKDCEEEIYKCSRCGLCQSVCPVYKATLNECAVSKAKFTMLNGILKGDLKLNKKIKEYMDLCTGCNACKNFCPSGIDAREIFTTVKSKYYSENKTGLIEQLLDSYLLFKTLLKTAKISFALYRFFRISALMRTCYTFMNKRMLLLDSLIELKVKRSKSIKVKKCKLKAVYFAGCFNDYLNPSSKNALNKIFSEIGIELIEKKFECCGVSYLGEGKIEEFKKRAQKNLSLLNEEYDYVLTDCASCNYVLKEYEKYIPSEKSKLLAQKTINILEFLKHRKITAHKPVTVTVHKPCHEDYDFIEIIKNIENVNYIEAQDFDKCCGFSGKFALKNEEISKKISAQKVQYLLNTEADCIITTCPACVLGVNQGLIEHKNNPTAKDTAVYNLIEFIAKHCTVFTA